MALCCNNDSLLSTTNSVSGYEQHDALDQSLGFGQMIGMPWNSDAPGKRAAARRWNAGDEENEPPNDNNDRLAAMRYAAKQAHVREKVAHELLNSGMPLTAPLDRAAKARLQPSSSNVSLSSAPQRTLSQLQGLPDRSSTLSFPNKSLSFAQSAWIPGVYSTSFQQVQVTGPVVSFHKTDLQGAPLAQSLFSRGGMMGRLVSPKGGTPDTASFGTGQPATTSPCSSFTNRSVARTSSRQSRQPGTIPVPASFALSPRTTSQRTNDFDIPSDLPDNMHPEDPRSTAAPAFMDFMTRTMTRSPPTMSREGSFSGVVAPPWSQDPGLGAPVMPRTQSRKPIKQNRTRHASLQKPEKKKDCRKSRSASLFWNPPLEAQHVCEAVKPPSFAIHAIHAEASHRRHDGVQHRPVATVVATARTAFPSGAPLPISYVPTGMNGSFAPQSPAPASPRNIVHAVQVFGSPYGSFRPPSRQGSFSTVGSPSNGSFRRV